MICHGLFVSNNLGPQIPAGQGMNEWAGLFKSSCDRRPKSGRGCGGELVQERHVHVHRNLGECQTVPLRPGFERGLVGRFFFLSTVYNVPKVPR